MRIFLPMLACALALLGSLAEAQPPAPWIHDIVTTFETLGKAPPERITELDRAAEIALSAEPDEDLRHVLRSRGVHDGLLLPVLLVDPEEPTVRRRWQMLLQDQVASQSLTHFGVARQGERLAVVFVRRALELDPIIASESDGRHLAISGRLASGYGDPVIYVTRPDQRVRSFRPMLLGQQISFKLPVQEEAAAIIEVIAAGPRGAEVVALLTVNHQGVTRTITRPRELTEKAGWRGPSDELIALVNEDRVRIGMSRLKPDSTLNQTASQHAQAMAKQGVVAHVLPGGEPPAERLGAAGVRTRRFFENVALARTVEQAHAELWESPSHRMALTDELITHIGVGVARAIGADGPVLYIVEHVAHRP
ncbi:MAG: hypothetical protein CL940_01650 [Deltaproteobacteria bacterium]|nr:hypothetical protein [Deltaproteobacteria bacterium]